MFFSEIYNSKVTSQSENQPTTGCFSTVEGAAFLSFNRLQLSTLCPFSASAKIIDHVHWDKKISFLENIKRVYSALVIFVSNCEVECLDGFLISSPSSFSKTPEILGEFLRRILTYLSENDPSGVSCLKEDISLPSWRYRFSNMIFFISTFSPCYNEFSSRSTMGGEYTFIMLQPKSSFNRKLSAFNKHNQHQYIMDKFCRKGIPYKHRELEWQKFVFPFNYNDEPVQWWAPKEDIEFENVVSYHQKCCIM